MKLDKKLKIVVIYVLALKALKMTIYPLETDQIIEGYLV